MPRSAPYRCPYCGAPAWLEPGEIDPPVDYCHEGDHGSPEDYPHDEEEDDPAR